MTQQVSQLETCESKNGRALLNLGDKWRQRSEIGRRDQLIGEMMVRGRALGIH